MYILTDYKLMPDDLSSERADPSGTLLAKKQ
jgi:hypothetical protein